MDNLTPTQLWAFLLAGASAFVLLSNAVEKIAKAVQLFRAPNKAQDERMDEFERRLDKYDGFFASDKARLDSLEKGNGASLRALLALLDHGIDGNNISQMQDAKAELQKHLIER